MQTLWSFKEPSDVSRLVQTHGRKTSSVLILEQDLGAGVTILAVSKVPERRTLSPVRRNPQTHRSLDICNGPLPLCKVAHCLCSRSLATSRNIREHLQWVPQGKICHKLSCLPHDYIHEQLNAILKGDGGVIGKWSRTEKVDDCRTWGHANYEWVWELQSI